MTWSYSGNPASSNMDAVRFEMGDTDSSDPLVQNEEINYALSKESGIYSAAARCLEAIARRFAREADNSLGPMRITASQKSKAFAEEAAKLRKKATAYGSPYAGGLSKAEDSTDAADADLKASTFSKGMMDNSSGSSKETVE